MNRIREFRKMRRWSQQKLGERIGCGVSNVSKFERNDQKVDLCRLRAIARAFSTVEAPVAPVDLLTDADNPDRLSSEERELVFHFRALNRENKAKLIQIATVLGDPVAAE